MRSVVVGLLEDWAQVPQAETFPAPGPSPEQLKRYPWLALARKYVRPGVDNSMEGIRESIEKGRAREMNEPIAGPRGTP